MESTAQSLKAVFSPLNFQGDKTPDFLEPGIYVFGRAMLKFTDMRVSRDQVQLNVLEDKVTAVRKGMNPSCIVKGSGASKKLIEMVRDQEYPIEQGDTLYLLVSLYPITFVHNTEKSTPKVHTDNISSPEVEINTKKRPREENSSSSPTKKPAGLLIVDSDQSDDEVAVLKKPKVSEEKVMVKPVAEASNSSWNFGLNVYLQDPAKHPEMVITYTNRVVVIKDKWPKARLHLLVMPRTHISKPSQLISEHIPILLEMIQIGTDLATQWMNSETGDIKIMDIDGHQEKIVALGPKSNQTTKVNLGFHALPSMSHLHLHVISNDMESLSMKTKKHWNSFTTEFFIDPNWILEQLKQNLPIHFDKKEYDSILERPLKCNKCGQSQATIPALKSHILICKSSNKN